MALPRDRLDTSIRTQFASNEYFAHVLAYELHHCKSGQIIRANDGHDYHVYPVEKTHPGLFAYILVPRGVSRPEVKILFRGTDDKASTIRDMEEKAPGYRSFMESRDQIFDALIRRLNEVHVAHPDSKISINIAGHSLGGADGQYMLIELLEKFLETRESALPIVYQHVNALSLALCNAPGVMKETVDKAKRVLAALKAKHFLADAKADGIQLAINIQHAAGDIVQQSGQGHILSDATQDDGVKTTLLKVFSNGDQSEKLFKNWLSFAEVKAAVKQVGEAHCMLFFSKENADNPKIRFDVYRNETKAGTAQIHEKLDRQISVVWPIRLLQKILAYFYSTVQHVSEGWVVVEQDKKTDVPIQTFFTMAELEEIAAINEMVLAKREQDAKAQQEYQVAEKAKAEKKAAEKKITVDEKLASTTADVLQDFMLWLTRPQAELADNRFPIRIKVPQEIRDLLFSLPAQEHKEKRRRPLALTYIPEDDKHVQPVTLPDRPMNLKSEQTNLPAEQSVAVPAEDQKLEIKSPVNEPIKVPQPLGTLLNESMRAALITEVDNYLNSRCYNENPNTLTWGSWLFRSKDITTDKIKLMKDVKNAVKTLKTIEEITKILAWGECVNTMVQTRKGKTYSFGMQSDVSRCLERLKKMINFSQAEVKNPVNLKVN
jgi:hypothetical protein